MKKAILAMTVAVACDGYRLVGLDPVPTSFDIHVTVAHDERLSAGVSAFFSPGRDEAGHEKAFADSTMKFNDAVVLPRRIGDGARLYEWRTDVVLGSSASVPDIISVIGPTLAGGDEWTRAIERPLPRRLDPFRREHRIGDTIYIQLPPVHSPSNSLGPLVRWQLHIGLANTLPEMSLQGSSASETRIGIPWQWLSEGISAGDSLDVRFSRFVDFALIDAPYPTHVAEFLLFSSRLIIVPAP